MVEIVILSLLTGSLGLLAASILAWLGWQQQRRQQEREEEEVLTQYESKDNGPRSETSSPPASEPVAPATSRLSGWEFKIVRANRNVFRKPATLKRVCDEEAEAGWILLEKLDERRLRFKRPMHLRDRLQPEALKRDPYRSRYGSRLNLSSLLVALALLLTLVLPAYLGYTLVHQLLTRRQETPNATPTLPPLRDSF